MARKSNNVIEQFQSQFGVMRDGEPLPAHWQKACKALSDLRGGQSFIIQDTETLDNDSVGNQSIYEFGAVYYDHVSGRAFYIHKYVEQDDGFNFDTYKDTHFASGLPDGFQGLMNINQTGYNKIKHNPGVFFNGARFISRRDFQNKLNEFRTMTNIAYNALFDLGHEKTQFLDRMESKGKGQNLPFEHPYDLMTMSADLFPEILGTYHSTGHYITLPKVYTALYNKLTPGQRKKYGFFLEPDKKTGIVAESHRALEDVMYLTVPVTCYLFDYVKEKARKDDQVNITNYEGALLYLEHKELTEEMHKKDVKHARKTGFTKDAGVVSPTYQSRQKPGRVAYGIYDLPDVNIKINETHYKSVENLITGLKTNITNNRNVEKAVENLVIGKTSLQSAAIRKLTAGISANGQYNVSNLLRSLDSSFREWVGKGKSLLDVVYTKTTDNKGTIINIHLIPNDYKFINAHSLRDFPTIKIPLGNDKQILSHYGMSGINQWKARIIDNQAVLMLTDMVQIQDLMEAIKNKKGKYLFDKGDYNQGVKYLQRIVYDARQTVQVAGEYPLDNKELLKARQGTGSEGQLIFRKSMIDFSSALRTVFTSARRGEDPEIVKLYKKSNDLGDSEYDTSVATEGALTDVKNILLICGAARTEKELNSEMRKIETNPRYRYLTNSSLWHNYLRDQIQTLGSVGIATGVSGENSFRNAVFATTGASELNPFGFLLAQDRRHVAQAMYTKDTHYGARKYRKAGDKQRRIFTSAEVAAGVPSGHASNTMFGYGYVTTEEIDKAWVQLHDKYKKEGKSEQEIIKRIGSRNIGAIEGGALYQLNSETADKLLAIDVKSSHVSRVRFDSVYQSYLKKKHIDPDKLKDEEVVKLQIEVFKNIQGLRNVQILPENFSFGEDRVFAEYVLSSPLRSGIKLLSTSDQDRGTYQGISKEWYEQILRNKNIKDTDFGKYEFLKEMPSSFKYNQIGGLIAGAVHNILWKLGSHRGAKGYKTLDEVKGVLNSSKFFGELLKDCIKFHPGKNNKDWYIEVTNSTELTRRVENIPAERQHEILDWVNDLGVAAGVTAKGDPLFKKEGDNYRLNTKYKGMTEVGQYAGDDYTGSEDKNKSDFRFRDAISRQINLMSATTGKDLGFLGEYLLQQAKPSAKRIKVYESLRKEAEFIHEKTSRSSAVDIIDKNHEDPTHISVGYNTGNIQYDIDLTEYEKSGKKLIDFSDAYVDGHIDPKAFNDSLLGAIDKARRERATSLGVSPEDITVSLELGKLLTQYDSQGHKAFSANRLYIPYFTRLNNIEEINSGGRGYDLPAYMSSFNKVVANLEEAHANGGEFRENAAENVFKAVQAMYAFSHEQKNGGWEYGNKSRLRVSSFNIANASNPQLVFSKDNDLWKQIGTYDAVINPSNMKRVLNILTIEPDDTPEEKLDKASAHARILFQTAENLFQNGTFKTAWGYIETLLDPVKNKSTLDNIKKVFFDKSLDIKSLSFKDVKHMIGAFAEFITVANTIGSDLFNHELRDRKVGLDALFSRFPYSNGLDVKFIQVYASGSVGKSSIQVGYGTGTAVNLDFDGDIPPIWYPLLEASMPAEDFKKLLEQTKTAKRAQRASTGLVALFTTPNTNSVNAGLIEASKINKVQQFQQQIGAAIVGKSLKGKTGELSNLYQLITNALFRMGLDENALGANSPFAKRRAAVLAMLVRAFFEKLTQDAISAKKVYDRIEKVLKAKGKTNPTPGDVVEEFTPELTELLTLIRDVGSYGKNSENGIKAILEKAKSMGVISVEGSPDRISAQVFGWAHDLFKAEKDQNKANKEFKQIFGVELNKVRIETNADGDPIKINGYDISTPDKRAKFIKMMSPDSGEDGKKFRRDLFGNPDFNFGLTERMFDVALTNINDTLKVNGTNVGEILRNYGGDLDKGLTTLSKLGLRVDQLLEISSDTNFGILKAELVKRNAPKNTNVDKANLSAEMSRLYKFKNQSVEDFLKDVTDSMGVLSVGVRTGKGHVIQLDEKWLADDPSGLKRKLQSQIDYIFSATQLAGVLFSGEHKAGGEATAYGSLHHAILDKYFKQGVFKLLGDEGNQRIDYEHLKKWIEAQWKNGGEDRELVAVVCDSKGHVDEKRYKQLYSTTNSFFIQAAKAGMLPSAVSEQTSGIVLHIGGKTILIGGTIDELWRMGNMDFIGDAKTSSYPYLEYVIQLALYNAIVRAINSEQENGALVSPQAKILLTPRNAQAKEGFVGSVINISTLSDEELVEFIEDALSVGLETNENSRKLKIDNLLWKWAPTLSSKRGAFGGASSGVSWETILDQLDKEYPMTSAERKYMNLYLHAKPAPRYPDGSPMPFDEWLLSYLIQEFGDAEGNKLFGHHQAFVLARGTYVDNWLNTLSSTQRKQAKDYIKNNAVGSKNYILSHWVFKNAYGKDHVVDFKQIYNNILHPNVTSHLKTKEEQERDRMEKEAAAQLLEAVKILTNYAAPGAGGSDSSSSGGNGSSKKDGFKFSNIEGQEGEDIGKALLTIKDLGEIADKIKNTESKENLMGTVNADIERLFGSGMTYEMVKEIGFDNFEELRKKATENSIIGRYNQSDEASNAAIQAGYGKAENSQATEIAKQNEEDMLKLTKERLKIYKELVKLQEQSNIAAKIGNQEEAEKLLALKKEKEEQAGITSMQALEEQIDQVSPEQRRQIEKEAKEKTKEEVNNAREQAKRRYLAARKQMGSSASRMEDYRRSYNTSFDKLQKNSLLSAMESEREQQGYYNDNTTAAFKELKKVFSDNEIEDIQKQATATDQVLMDRVAVKHKGQDTLWGQLGSQMSNILTRFTQMGAAYKIIGKIREGFNTVVQSAKNLDKAMTDLRIVTGQTGNEARQTMGKFADLASELGVSTTEVAQSATAWLRQGYNMVQVNDLVTSSLYLSRLGMISVDEATKDLTSSLKGFKLEATEAMDVVDKLTALDVKAATTAGEIATGLAQFANLANLNGINIDQAAAMVATIADVSQVSGSQAGNSIKMMLSRYGTVKSGKFESMEEGDESTSLNDVEKVLNRIGVSIRDTNLQFREFDDVLEDISEKWDTLDNVSKNAVATALAGTRQREAFLVLMSNMDKYKQFTEVSESSEGTAAKKYVAYTEQLEASQKRLAAAWEKFSQDADIARFLKMMTDLATMAVKILPTILKYLTRWIATTQAHKIPGIVQTISPFFSLPQMGFGKGKAFLSGRMKSGQKAAMYQDNKGNIVTDKVFDALSPEEQKKYRGMTNFAESGAKGYQSAILADLKGIRADVAAIAGRKGTADRQVGPTDGMEGQGLSDAERELMRDPSLHQGKNGLYYTKKRNGAISKADYNRMKQAYDKEQEQEKARSEQLTRQNKTATALTVAMGTLSNIMTASTTSVNYAKIGGAKNFKDRLKMMGEMQEASQDAQIGAKVTTGLTSLAGGIIGGVAGKNAQAAALGTQIGGALGDIVSKYVVMPLIDRTYNDRQEVMQRSTQVLAGLTSIEDSTNTLGSLSHSGQWTDAQYKEAKEASDDLLAKMYSADNEDTRQILEKYLTQIITGQADNGKNTITMYEAMDRFMDGSEADREMIIRALRVAEIQARNEALLGTFEDKRAELQSRSNAKNLGTNIGAAWSQSKYALPTQNMDFAVAGLSAIGGPIGMIVGSLVNQTQHIIDHAVTREYDKDHDYNGSDSLAGKYAAAGFTVKEGHDNFWAGAGASILSFLTLGFVDLKKTWIDTSSMTLDEQEEAFSNLIDNEMAKGDKADAALIENGKQQLKEIKAIRAETEKMYDQMNEGYIQEAALMVRTDQRSENPNGTLLAEMNSAQLKSLGKDEILLLIGEYLAQSGKFMGHEVFEDEDHTTLTKYARDRIISSLRTDSKYSGIMSGQAYTISEVMKMGEGPTKQEYIANFAAALGITIDEFTERYGELISKYGDVTLGTLLETPDQVREHINEAANLLKQMATSSGLLAENIEQIIKNYPTLLKYVNDYKGMAAELINNIDQYKQIYARKIYDELKNSEEYYRQELLPTIEGALTEEEYKQFQAEMGDATSAADLINWIANGGSLAEKVGGIVSNTMSHRVSAEVTDVIEEITTGAASKLLDRQIENLNEQKEALQKINEEREYENKLIEAKLKLEDAAKEKKRVWREGVGWTYESDQTALDEAQKNLDEVKNEKKISELEVQIQELQAQKDYLSKLPEEEELKKMMAVYETWKESQEGMISSVYDLVKALQEYKESNKVDLGLIDEEVETRKANKQKAKEALEELYNNADGEGHSLDYLKEHQNDSAEAALAYNKALQRYQNAYDSYNEKGWIDDSTFGRTQNEDGTYSYGTSSGFGSQESYNATGAAEAGDDAWKMVEPGYYYFIKTSYNAVNNPAGRQNHGRALKQGDRYSINTSSKMWTDAIVNDADLAVWPLSGGKIGQPYRASKADTSGWENPSQMPDGIYWSWDNNWPSDGSHPLLYLSKNGVGYRLIQKHWYEWMKGANGLETREYNSLNPEDAKIIKDKGWRYGSLGIPGGLSLINEVGTEAIITPEGTITSLPSGTGIVPADITRNVWQLGELAPAILRSLGYPNNLEFAGNANINNSDSLNIGSVTMNVNADSSFDPTKFVEQLKQQASLTKNNKR